MKNVGSTVAPSLFCESKLFEFYVSRQIITNFHQHKFPRPFLSTRISISKHLTTNLPLECFHCLKPRFHFLHVFPPLKKSPKDLSGSGDKLDNKCSLKNVAGSHKSLLRHAWIALIAFLLCHFHGRLKRIYLEQTKSRWRLPRKLLLCFWRK